jgi:site-specific DNA-methyltransferase (adenine-specific)
MIVDKAEGDGWTLYLADTLLAVPDIVEAHPRLDCLLTDPPYSSGGAFRVDALSGQASAKYSKGDFADFDGDSRDQLAMVAWMATIIATLKRAMRQGSTWGFFCDWRQIVTMVQAAQVGGLVYRGALSWVKPHARPQLGRPTNQTEFVVWGSNGPLPVDRDAETMRGAYQCAAPHDRQHPTEKPLDLMMVLVELCERGGTIIDPFCGSGTTGVAALRSGRRFVGIESVRHYFDVARERLASDLTVSPDLTTDPLSAMMSRQ